MSTLVDEVTSVVRNLLSQSQLFTALDVSNIVKKTCPHARHREVRDVVRSLYTSEMVNGAYASTPIQVTLHDGSTREALLYHPITDSWDLDSKYDNSRRAQTSIKSNLSGSNTVTTDDGVTAGVASDGTVSVQPAVVSTPVSKTTSNVVTKTSAHDAWGKLFNSQPSLFPRK